MSPHFSTLVTLLILIILGLLFVSFVYVWLFIAKKQRLVSYLKPLDKKKEKRRKWRERLWTPVVKAADYVGPTAVKYPLMFDLEQDRQQLVRAGNPMGMDVETFHGLRFVLGFGSLLFSTLYTFLGMPFALLLLVVLPLSGFMFPSA